MFNTKNTRPKTPASLSVAQLDKYQACPKLHYYHYITEERRDYLDSGESFDATIKRNESIQFDKRCHKLLESYLKGSTVDFPDTPVGRICSIAKDHLPRPKSGEVAKFFEYKHPRLSVPIIGSIDFCTLTPVGGRIILWVYKTLDDTGILNTEELAKSNQVIVHSQYLFSVTDANVIHVNFLYIHRSIDFVERITFELTRSEVDTAFNSLLPVFREIIDNFNTFNDSSAYGRSRRESDISGDIPRNLKNCDKAGGCIHRSTCLLALQGIKYLKYLCNDEAFTEAGNSLSYFLMLSELCRMDLDGKPFEISVATKIKNFELSEFNSRLYESGFIALTHVFQEQTLLGYIGLSNFGELFMTKDLEAIFKADPNSPTKIFEASKDAIEDYLAGRGFESLKNNLYTLGTRESLSFVKRLEKLHKRSFEGLGYVHLQQGSKYTVGMGHVPDASFDFKDVFGKNVLEVVSVLIPDKNQIGFDPDNLEGWTWFDRLSKFHVALSEAGEILYTIDVPKLDLVGGKGLENPLELFFDDGFDVPFFRSVWEEGISFEILESWKEYKKTKSKKNYDHTSFNYPGPLRQDRYLDETLVLSNINVDRFFEGIEEKRSPLSEIGATVNSAILEAQGQLIEKQKQVVASANSVEGIELALFQEYLAFSTNVMSRIERLMQALVKKDK